MNPETITLPAFTPITLPPTSAFETFCGRHVYGERLQDGQVVSVQIDVRDGEAEIMVCVDDSLRMARLQVPRLANIADLLCGAQDLLRACLGYPALDDEAHDPDDWDDELEDDACPALGRGVRLPDPTSLELADTTLRVEDGDTVAVVGLGVLAAHSWRRAHLLLQAA